MTTTPAAAPLFAVPRDEVWVRCPRCSGPALIRHGVPRCARCAWTTDGGKAGHWCACCQQWEGDRPAPVGDRRVMVERRCRDCGRRESFTTTLRPAQSARPRACACGGRPELVRHWPLSRDMAADGIDALYGLPFYLTTSCAGHRLWAANEAHLDYLEGFVGAKIRTVHQTPVGRELGYKLPRWMLLASNRDKVLSALAELRAMLPEPARR
ncbi:hypothetical protein [Saccharopolyspora antimicrobica]|nr:hypothetical protein [Saccharopolyspora antimicrobica]